MLRSPRWVDRIANHARLSLALATVIGSVGCLDILGISGVPLSIQIVDYGPATGQIIPPEVRFEAGTLKVKVHEFFSDPGYEVKGSADFESGTGAGASKTLLIEASIKRLKGDFVSIVWFKDYEFSVTDLPSGPLGLRLRWKNPYGGPGYLSRILVDTVVTIP